MSARPRCPAALHVLVLLLAAPYAAPAQAPALRVSTGVVPDTVTVGDRFRSVVRVTAPAGARVSFLPPPLSDSLQPVDSMRLLRADGARPAAVFTLVAWVTGDSLAAFAPVTVRFPDGRTERYHVALRLPFVRSVLPAATAELRPRPARGVLAAPGRVPWWVWLAAALLAAALASAAWRAWRRRGPAEVQMRETPRERALRRLDEIAATGAPDALRQKEFYSEVAQALRHYLASLSPGWGVELTTAELQRRLPQAPLGPAAASALVQLLALADRVKFARHRPDPAEARRFWSEAHDWVAAQPAGPAAPEKGRAA